MEQRKAEYKNALSLHEWLKQRERMKIELGIELRGDLTVEEEKFLKSQIDEKLEKTNNLRRAADESNKKLQQMEDAFEKLRSVTCVEKVDEMHEKFSMQKVNKMQLELEVKDAEMRLNAAKRVKNKLEEQFQELKATEGGQQELNRDNIQKHIEAFNDVCVDQKFMKADFERMRNVLVCYLLCSADHFVLIAIIIVGSEARCCWSVATYSPISESRGWRCVWSNAIRRRC